MANKIAKAKEAASQFLNTANPEDEFFLVGFNDRANFSVRLRAMSKVCRPVCSQPLQRAVPPYSVPFIWGSVRCEALVPAHEHS